MLTKECNLWKRGREREKSLIKTKFLKGRKNFKLTINWGELVPVAVFCEMQSFFQIIPTASRGRLVIRELQEGKER